MMRRTSRLTLQLLLLLPLLWALPPGARAVIASYDPRSRQDAKLDAVRNAPTFKADLLGFDASTANVFAVDGQIQRIVVQLESVKRGLTTPDPELDDALMSQKLAEVADRLEEFSFIGSSNDAQLQHSMFYAPYALHRYRGQVAWSQAAKNAIRSMILDSNWPASVQSLNGNPDNWSLPFIGAYLLAGEALPDAGMLETGLDLLHLVEAAVARQGGTEVHTPHYGHFQWSFLALLTDLDDPAASLVAEAILAYTMLVDAHLYLPGGGLGMPQPRGTRSGSTHIVDPPENEVQHLLSRLNLFVGDPELVADPTLPLPVYQATSDYRVPDVIRSIFLDKEDGYEYFARQKIRSNLNLNYQVGWQNSWVVPWQTVTLPDGAAQMGIMYGNPDNFGRDASFGVYVKTGTLAFDKLAHIHWNPGNHSQLQYGDEYFTYRRMMRGATLIQLWDASGIAPNYTQAHVPGWVWNSGVTAASPTGNDWRVGQLGDVFLAFLPLGSIDLEADQDGGAWTHVELEALSGSIVELAWAPDYQGDINAYVADLAGRQPDFGNADVASLFAEVTASTGERIRLDYATDTRWLDTGTGLEAQSLDYFRHGMMESPWVTWDGDELTLTVSRPGYPDAVYDYGDPSLPTPPSQLKLLANPPRVLPSDPIPLTWRGSSDLEGIDHYEVFQILGDGETVVEVAEFPTSPGTYDPGTSAFVQTATFFVRGVDTDGNVSRKTHLLQVGNVAGDGVPPSQVVVTANIQTAEQITLTWPVATDNDAIAGYEVFRDGALVSTQTDFFYNDTDLVPNATYTYTVRAFDPTGNRAPQSEPVVAKAGGGGGGGCGLLGIEPIAVLGLAWVRRRRARPPRSAASYPSASGLRS